jgi:ribosomal protein L39E
MAQDAVAMGPVELKFSLVTSPSHHLLMHDRTLTRGQARRMSRRFGDVGVTIPATRLRQISAGSACLGDAEQTDVSFAVAATEIEREQRLAKLKRNKRRVMQWLIVAGMTLVVLNALLCAAYFLGLAWQASPY